MEQILENIKTSLDVEDVKISTRDEMRDIYHLSNIASGKAPLPQSSRLQTPVQNPNTGSREQAIEVIEKESDAKDGAQIGKDRLDTMSLEYERLSKDDIRLLTVVHHDGAAAILRLETHPRDRAPDYDALSYAWGEDTSTSFTLCNGFQLSIRSNLFDALPLIHKARPAPRRPLWIDAICLNQEDAEEKADHVPLMGIIYERATRTLVWLGQAADDSDLAMDNLSELRTYMQTQNQDELEHYGITDPSAILQYHGLAAQTDPIWSGVQALFERRWFYRLWTLQEIVLAQDPTIICGGKCIDWTVLPSFVQAVNHLRLGWLCFGLGDTQSTGAYKYEGNQLVTQIHGMRTRLRPLRNAMFLPTLLSFSKSRGYTLPVDRIWAVMGLLSPFSQKIIREANLVDYGSEAYSETYLGVMKVHIEHLPVAAIQLLEHGLTHAKNSRLPSWCPDWDRGQICTPIALKPGVAAGKPDGSSSSKGPTKLLRPAMSADYRCLTVLGLPLDTIRYVSRNVGRFWGSYIVNDSHDWGRLRSSCIWATESLNAVSGSARGEPTAEAGDAAIIELWNMLQDCSRALDALLFPGKVKFDMSDFVLWCNGRKFFRTDSGRYGLGHPDMKEGDVVSVLYGGVSLVLLRPHEETLFRNLHLDLLRNRTLEVIGDAYVPGLMHGEGFRGRSCEDMMELRLV